MSSLLDLYSGPSSSGNALGSILPGLAGVYGINRQPAYQQEDAQTGMTRLGRGFDRSLFHLNNTGAAKGQWGSSGLAMRGDELNQDTQDKAFDIQTNLARNLADVATQRATTFMGLY